MSSIIDASELWVLLKKWRITITLLIGASLITGALLYYIQPTRYVNRILIEAGYMLASGGERTYFEVPSIIGASINARKYDSAIEGLKGGEAEIVSTTAGRAPGVPFGYLEVVAKGDSIESVDALTESIKNEVLKRHQAIYKAWTEAKREEFDELTSWVEVMEGVQQTLDLPGDEKASIETSLMLIYQLQIRREIIKARHTINALKWELDDSLYQPTHIVYPDGRAARQKSIGLIQVVIAAVIAGIMLALAVILVFEAMNRDGDSMHQ